MAKRSNKDDGGMNLDSLLDTMTNVVGILIIVLIVTQLNVAAAVKRIFSEFPPVSEEKLVELKEEVEKEKEDLADLEKADPEEIKEEEKELEEEVAAAEAKRNTAKEELEGLKKTDAANKVLLMKLEEAVKAADAKKREVDAKEEEVNALLAEIAQIKAALDDNPVLTAPPAKVVKMPDPRSIPDGASEKLFYCAGDRVIYFPINEFSEELAKVLERAATDRLNPQWAKIVSSVKEKTVGGRKVKTNVYDPRQVAAFLKANPVENATMRAEFTVPETSNRARMTLTPKEGAGEPVGQLANPASGFQRGVRSMRSQAIYLWFVVYPDGFDTYLQARNYVDEVGVPAGWEPGGAPGTVPTVTRNIYTVEFKRLKAPPPPDPTKPPPPPAPKRPGRTLD